MNASDKAAFLKNARFVDGLPMTITGKVRKFVMRDRMIEELGLVPATTA